MADTNEHAHQLIEQLAPSQLSAVVGLLEVMVDPLLRSIGRNRETTAGHQPAL